MIEFPNGARLVEDVSELPRLPDHISTLYGDFETTSGSPKLKSTNPWHNCDVLGIAATWDDAHGSWYLPVAHHHGVNLPREAVQRWWQDAVSKSDEWTNHNVKYDTHVSTNYFDVDPLAYGVRLKCSLTLAKIIDSDRLAKGGYGLDALSRDWLHEDITYLEKAIHRYLRDARGNWKCRDYAACPSDVMGEYAGQDVVTNRRLDQYEESRCPDQCRTVWNTEIELTSVLVDMERTGWYVDPTELKIEQFKAMHRMTTISEELQESTGRLIRPNVPEDCYDLLCNQFGLPVVAWTTDDEGNRVNPSFTKDALQEYLGFPDAPVEIIERLLEYRKLNTACSLFLEPYQTLNIDGLIHPTFNQCVRTGRMSCGEPNMQQLSKFAKRLMHPPPGFSVIAVDFSQIEFRLIVHFIKNEACIKRYNDDPSTDFHSWVADECGMDRSPAKNVNFMAGYGGGKKRTVGMLRGNRKVISEVQEKVDALIESSEIAVENRQWAVGQLVERRALAFYAKYHDTLPELKPTSRRAGDLCRHRGYVFNLRGRRRYLPPADSHKAFNSLCQSSAADIMKERAVAAHRMAAEVGIRMNGLVHDEFTFLVPTGALDDPRTVTDLVGCLEDVDVADVLRVPIRTTCGWSGSNWAEASGMEQRLDGTSGRLQHLRK